MATYKLQLVTASDSLLARDSIVNTFHLDDHGIGSDPENLIVSAVELWQTFYGETRQIRGLVYDTGAAPNYPKAEHVVNEGVAGEANFPREVALCLSYYGERNLPRTRGRIYLCAAIARNFGADHVRPTPGDMAYVMMLAQGIADLGGADVDWITWSSIDGAHEKVQHAWCDNEWDTMRSRGLRSTTRTAIALGE